MKTFTVIHVLISFVGIFSGFVVVYGFLARKPSEKWTAIFLATTVATSVTGFGFPFERLLPSHIVGIISLVILAPAIYARYRRHLAGRWRTVYVIGAVISLYLNVFVLVVQAFLKTPALKALAPTQTEPPFKIAQGIVFAIFVTLGVLSVIRFRIAPISEPASSQTIVIPARRGVSN